MKTAPPETRFVTCGENAIAYQVVGDGPLDLFYLGGSYSHVDAWWEHPVTARFLRALASFSRLILYDRLGTGASDRVPTDRVPSIESTVDEMRTVLDVVGSERTAIFGGLDGGCMGLALAALHPERVRSLVLFNTTARYRHAEGYPCGRNDEDADAFIDRVYQAWGTEAFVAMCYPDHAGDTEFVRWITKSQRIMLGKAHARAFTRGPRSGRRPS